MKPDTILSPPSEFTHSDIYSRKCWRAVQHLENNFWQRWRTEYLCFLQSHQKWVNQTGREIKTGNIVNIVDNSDRNK